MIPACDVSKYQGTIDWANMPEIVIIKMSGGDAGLYMDSNAATNYNGAKAAGKHVGGYHFAGYGNSVAEANYFMQAMSPLAENDVYALDVENVPSGLDVIQWVETFMATVHTKIQVWPLIYMNLSTLNAHNWDNVLTNSGLWLADWNNNPSGTIATVHEYVMQQYSDGPNYDHDEWFGTVESFDKYGYHAPVVPSPAESPAETSTPVESTPPEQEAGQGSEQNTNTTLPQLTNNIPQPTTPTQTNEAPKASPSQSSPSQTPYISRPTGSWLTRLFKSIFKFLDIL